MENSAAHVIFVIFLLVFLSFFIYESRGIYRLFNWRSTTARVGAHGALGEGDLHDAAPARSLRPKLASHGILMEQSVSDDKAEPEADTHANSASMAAGRLRGTSLG